MKLKQIGISTLERKANHYHKSGKSWHFHILTPLCKLNEKKAYAFLLENSTDSESFVSYSKSPRMRLGQKLLKLLHGIKISKNMPDKQSKLPTDVQVIVDRAKELTNMGYYWHHHLLLPSCIFNETDQYLMIFEDQKNNKLLKAFSETEPKAGLQIIETLYYSQKHLK